jgi:hypothetical protein
MAIGNNEQWREDPVWEDEEDQAGGSNLGGDNDSGGGGGASPLPFGPRGGAGDSQPSNWQQLIDMAMGRIQNPSQFTQTATNWYADVMAPGYSYYSPEQFQSLYKQGEDTLKGGIFQQMDDYYGSSMAGRGLTGSGVAGLDYGKILGQKGGALGQLWGGLQQQNIEGTQQNIARALGLGTTLDAQQQGNIMDLLNVLLGEKNANAQADANDSNALGGILGIIGSLFL